MPLHPPRHLYRFQWPQEPLMVPDDVVDNAVLDPLFGTRYVVAVGVALDPLVILACILGKDLVQAALGRCVLFCVFFFASRRRHTTSLCDWSSDVCCSDLGLPARRRGQGQEER